MTQRVNIQYSIEIDELPGEVQRLFEKAQKEIDEFTRTNSEWDVDFLSLTTLDKIDQLRHSLASIDHNFHDVSNIINGYITYKTMPGPTEDAAQEHSADTGELHQQLQKFKESVGKGALDEEPTTR